jgi:hypothetical protein
MLEAEEVKRRREVPVVLPAAVAWARWRLWSYLGHEGSHRCPFCLL